MYDELAKSFPSLKKIVTIKIVTTMLEASFGNKSLRLQDVCFSTKTNTYPVEDIIQRKLKKICLHQCLKEEILELSKCITFELYEWFNLVLSISYPNISANKMIWTNNATINKMAVVEKYIQNDTRERILIFSCRLCREDLIKEYMVKNVCKIITSEILYQDYMKYWLEYCENQDQTVTDGRMFNICVDLTNEFGIKYFWRRLTTQERKDGFEKITVNYFKWQQGVYIELLIFMLDNSTEVERIHFYSVYALGLLKSLIFYWPDLNVVLNVLTVMIRQKFLTHEEFIQFSRYVLMNIRPNFPLYHQRELLFRRVWKIFENEASGEVVLSPIGINELQMILFRPLDINWRTVKFLGRSRLFQRLKRSVLNSKSAYTYFFGLLSQGHYVLRKFLAELQLTEEESLEIQQNLRANVKGFEAAFNFRSKSF